MKITEFENEEALDLVVDIIEPVGRLFEDKMFVSAIQSGNRMKAVKIALREHQKDILFVLARMEGKKPEEYKGNIITMTKQILDILSDKELSDFFISQGLMEADDASSDPMENIEEKES